MALSITEASSRLLDCVCDALSDDLRPVCSCYQSLGTPVIFQCCECEDVEGNGELSIHVQRLFDADPNTLDEVQRVRPCRGGTTAARVRLVLARCRPTINSQGELPAHDVLTEYSENQMRDIEVMWRALTCCTDLHLRVDDISVDLSEPGTCSIIYADATVEVTVPPLPAGSL